jgi:1-acyl-sn-glycerol-3-phosphate acyltransferase
VANGETVKAALARVAFRLARWRIVGEFPKLPRYVVCAAPHTSNWDFFFFLMTKWLHGGHVLFFAKHTLFRQPGGWILRALGARPVDRGTSAASVSSVVEDFATHSELVVLVAPEGMLGAADYWKSGFYFMAKSANVPIVCVSLDFETREVRVSEPLTPGGAVRDDMDRIRKIYAGVRALHPSRVGPVRLRAERS